LDESKAIPFDISAPFFEVRQNVRHHFRVRLRPRMLAQFRIGINVTGLQIIQATRVMKELKFNCPSCGQHIQCDVKHAGENVPCPGCAALIQVPYDGDVTDVPSPPTADSPFAAAAGDVEKVSYASTKAADGPEQKKSPAAAAGADATSTSSSPANPAPPAALELHCVCPVCQSALRILVEPEPHLEAAHHAAQTSAEHLPTAERERQIAAGRARVLHKMTAKPRLDRILGGQAAEPSSPSEKK
jgi:ribosomal protein S27E